MIIIYIPKISLNYEKNTASVLIFKIIIYIDDGLDI